jgi:hypothetical protein
LDWSSHILVCGAFDCPDTDEPVTVVLAAAFEANKPFGCMQLHPCDLDVLDRADIALCFRFDGE